MENDNFMQELYVEEIGMESIVPNIYGLTKKLNELISKHNLLVDQLCNEGVIDWFDDDDEENIIEGEEIDEESEDQVKENDTIFATSK